MALVLGSHRRPIYWSPPERLDLPNDDWIPSSGRRRDHEIRSRGHTRNAASQQGLIERRLRTKQFSLAATAP
ncbi:hypothetical protein L596_018714 [Steinernema carpocapsae]|uniref:Uncharacterized protein n=1 Tax=Steinernema carpocapsae TaxID=34508 RepID=A0A4U5N6A2_STECR|nr:hypothetical protein L596_018714 [Steinernema carpocapsae]